MDGSFLALLVFITIFCHDFVCAKDDVYMVESISVSPSTKSHTIEGEGVTFSRRRSLKASPSPKGKGGSPSNLESVDDFFEAGEKLDEKCDKAYDKLLKEIGQINQKYVDLYDEATNDANLDVGVEHVYPFCSRINI